MSTDKPTLAPLKLLVKTALAIVAYGSVASVPIGLWLRYHLDAGMAWTWLYDHVEIVGPVGGLLFLLLLDLPSGDEMAFRFIPFALPWWRYLAFGISSALLMLGILASLVCVVLVLPVLLPIKLLQVDVLGPNATLSSAIVALPLAFATTSGAFALAFLTLMVKNRGNLVRDEVPLYDAEAGGPWPLGEIFYYSLSTMLKGSQRYEATGWCRWLALVEIISGRLLEVLIVTIGIGVIIKTHLAAGGH